MCGSACTAGASFANLLLALLHTRSSTSLPSPPHPLPSAPSPCSQVWPEGSPSILTGVSKEVSAAILFYTPSLPEQRCCTKRPAACLLIVFCYSCDHQPIPHPSICPVMLHHFIPDVRLTMKEGTECFYKYSLTSWTCRFFWDLQKHDLFLFHNIKYVSEQRLQRSAGTLNIIIYGPVCLYQQTKFANYSNSNFIPSLIYYQVFVESCFRKCVLVFMKLKSCNHNVVHLCCVLLFLRP